MSDEDLDCCSIFIAELYMMLPGSHLHNTMDSRGRGQ